MNNSENIAESGVSQKIKNAFKKIYDRLIKIRGTPRDIAFGFALGVFISTSPTLGLQMAIAIFLASLLKCSKIAAAAGVWVSNPLTAPVIYSLTYFIGSKIMGIRARNPIPDDIDHTGLQRLLEKTPDFFWCLIIGGVVIGIPLAVIAYYFSYSAVTRYQNSIKEQIAKQKQKLKNKRDAYRRKKNSV